MIVRPRVGRVARPLGELELAADQHSRIVVEHLGLRNKADRAQFHLETAEEVERLRLWQLDQKLDVLGEHARVASQRALDEVDPDLAKQCQRPIVVVAGERYKLSAPSKGEVEVEAAVVDELEPDGIDRELETGRLTVEQLAAAQPG